MDDLHIVVPMIGPWQRARVDEPRTPYPAAVTQFLLELALKLRKRPRIPMDVLGGTGFDWDTLERILREHIRGNSEARKNRERA